jgi:hypothetical protein
MHLLVQQADRRHDFQAAYGGYHWDTLNGVNVDAGIFMSYVSLYSYYQFDNWSYRIDDRRLGAGPASVGRANDGGPAGEVLAGS